MLTKCRLLVYWFKMRIKLIILLLAIFGPMTAASAMERWAALSMIESGDDDNAIGPGGEVSRDPQL